MPDSATMTDDVRNRIISEPDVILGDIDVMRALIDQSDTALGDNVVDLRGVLMRRLSERLDHLEQTHRSVIAAAHDNLAATAQVQRAVLRLLDATDFVAFLRDLNGDVAAILRLDALRLVLETEGDGDPALSGLVGYGHPGFIADYLTRGRDMPQRRITLRPCQGAAPGIYGMTDADLRCEACLLLDLGADRLPGLLVMGSVDPDLFTPAHGTELLEFFAGAVERALRRWPAFPA